METTITMSIPTTALSWTWARELEDLSFYGLLLLWV